MLHKESTHGTTTLHTLASVLLGNQQLLLEDCT
jgi:hypothetical protein